MQTALLPACHQHEPERRSGRKQGNRNGVPGRSGPILALQVGLQAVLLNKIL